MNHNKVGLISGSFAGLLHLVWSVCIAFGFAQPLLDFLFRMHSLNDPFVVAPFDLERAAGLVVMTAIVGYIGGNIWAVLWNKFHK